jgi:hypothetical protein
VIALEDKVGDDDMKRDLVALGGGTGAFQNVDLWRERGTTVAEGPALAQDFVEEPREFRPHPVGKLTGGNQALQIEVASAWGAFQYHLIQVATAGFLHPMEEHGDMIGVGSKHLNCGWWHALDPPWCPPVRRDETVKLAGGGLENTPALWGGPVHRTCVPAGARGSFGVDSRESWEGPQLSTKGRVDRDSKVSRG